MTAQRVVLLGGGRPRWKLCGGWSGDGCLRVDGGKAMISFLLVAGLALVSVGPQPCLGLPMKGSLTHLGVLEGDMARNLGQNNVRAREALSEQSASGVVDQLSGHMEEIARDLKKKTAPKPEPLGEVIESFKIDQEEVKPEEEADDDSIANGGGERVLRALPSQTVELSCNVEGAESIVWVKDRMAAPQGLAAPRGTLRLLLMRTPELKAYEIYAGNYWCMASNNFFTSVSDPIRLEVADEVEDAAVVIPPEDAELADMYELSMCHQAIETRSGFLSEHDYALPPACNMAASFCESLQTRLCEDRQKTRIDKSVIDDDCVSPRVKCVFLVRDCFIRHHLDFDFCFFGRVTTLFAIPRSADHRLVDLRYSLGGAFGAVDGFDANNHEYRIVLRHTDKSIDLRFVPAAGAHVSVTCRELASSIGLTNDLQTGALDVGRGQEMTLDVTVTASNGKDAGVYTIVVERGSRVRNVDIDSLDLLPNLASGGFAFDPDRLRYEGLEVDFTVTKITLIVNKDFPNDADFNVGANFDRRVRVRTGADEENSVTVPLLPGMNRIEAQMTSEESRGQVYEIYISRALDNGTALLFGPTLPLLDALVVLDTSNVQIPFPAVFDPEWPIYHLHVPNEEQSIRLRAISTGSDAMSVTVNGCCSIKPNVDTEPIPLVPGSNILTVLVDNAGSNTAFEYRITIVRDFPLSTHTSRDTRIHRVRFMLTPFDKDWRNDDAIDGTRFLTDTPHVNTESDVQGVLLDVEMTNEFATVSIDGDTVPSAGADDSGAAGGIGNEERSNADASGGASNGEIQSDEMSATKFNRAVRLLPGPNPIDVVVTAANSQTQSTYTIVFDRQRMPRGDSSIVGINNIFAAGGSRVEPYLERSVRQADIWETDYEKFSVTLGGHTEEVLISASPAARGSFVEINGRAVEADTLSRPIPFSLTSRRIDVPISVAPPDGRDIKLTATLSVFRASADTNLKQFRIVPCIESFGDGDKAEAFEYLPAAEHVIDALHMLKEESTATSDKGRVSGNKVVAPSEGKLAATLEIELPDEFSMFMIQVAAKHPKASIETTHGIGECRAVTGLASQVRVSVTAEDQNVKTTYLINVKVKTQSDPVCGGIFMANSRRHASHFVYTIPRRHHTRWTQGWMVGLTPVKREGRLNMLNSYLRYLTQARQHTFKHTRGYPMIAPGFSSLWLEAEGVSGGGAGGEGGGSNSSSTSPPGATTVAQKNQPFIVNHMHFDLTEHCKSAGMYTIRIAYGCWPAETGDKSLVTQLIEVYINFRRVGSFEIGECVPYLGQSPKQHEAMQQADIVIRAPFDASDNRVDVVLGPKVRSSTPPAAAERKDKSNFLTLLYINVDRCDDADANLCANPAQQVCITPSGKTTPVEIDGTSYDAKHREMSNINDHAKMLQAAQKCCGCGGGLMVASSFELVPPRQLRIFPINSALQAARRTVLSPYLFQNTAKGLGLDRGAGGHVHVAGRITISDGRSDGSAFRASVADTSILTLVDNVPASVNVELATVVPENFWKTSGAVADFSNVAAVLSEQLGDASAVHALPPAEVVGTSLIFTNYAKMLVVRFTQPLIWVDRRAIRIDINHRPSNARHTGRVFADDAIVIRAPTSDESTGTQVTRLDPGAPKMPFKVGTSTPGKSTLRYPIVIVAVGDDVAPLLVPTHDARHLVIDLTKVPGLDETLGHRVREASELSIDIVDLPSHVRTASGHSVSGVEGMGIDQVVLGDTEHMCSCTDCNAPFVGGTRGTNWIGGGTGGNGLLSSYRPVTECPVIPESGRSSVVDSRCTKEIVGVIDRCRMAQPIQLTMEACSEASGALDSNTGVCAPLPKLIFPFGDRRIFLGDLPRFGSGRGRADPDTDALKGALFFSVFGGFEIHVAVRTVFTTSDAYGVPILNVRDGIDWEGNSKGSGLKCKLFDAHSGNTFQAGSEGITFDAPFAVSSPNQLTIRIKGTVLDGVVHGLLGCIWEGPSGPAPPIPQNAFHITNSRERQTHILSAKVITTAQDEEASGGIDKSYQMHTHAAYGSTGLTVSGEGVSECQYHKRGSKCGSSTRSFCYGDCHSNVLTPQVTGDNMMLMHANSETTLACRAADMKCIGTQRQYECKPITSDAGDGMMFNLDCPVCCAASIATHIQSETSFDSYTEKDKMEGKDIKSFTFFIQPSVWDVSDTANKRHYDAAFGIRGSSDEARLEVIQAPSSCRVGMTCRIGAVVRLRASKKPDVDVTMSSASGRPTANSMSLRFKKLDPTVAYPSIMFQDAGVHELTFSSSAAKATSVQVNVFDKDESMCIYRNPNEEGDNATVTLQRARCSPFASLNYLRDCRIGTDIDTNREASLISVEGYTVTQLLRGAEELCRDKSGGFDTLVDNLGGLLHAMVGFNPFSPTMQVGVHLPTLGIGSSVVTMTVSNTQEKYRVLNRRYALQKDRVASVMTGEVASELVAAQDSGPGQSSRSSCLSHKRFANALVIAVVGDDFTSPNAVTEAARTLNTAATDGRAVIIDHDRQMREFSELVTQCAHGEQSQECNDRAYEYYCNGDIRPTIAAMQQQHQNQASVLIVANFGRQADHLACLVSNVPEANVRVVSVVPSSGDAVHQWIRDSGFVTIASRKMLTFPSRDLPSEQARPIHEEITRTLLGAIASVSEANQAQVQQSHHRKAHRMVSRRDELEHSTGIVRVFSPFEVPMYQSQHPQLQGSDNCVRIAACIDARAAGGPILATYDTKQIGCMSLSWNDELVSFKVRTPGRKSKIVTSELQLNRESGAQELRTKLVASLFLSHGDSVIQVNNADTQTEGNRKSFDFEKESIAMLNDFFCPDGILVGEDLFGNGWKPGPYKTNDQHIYITVSSVKVNSENECIIKDNNDEIGNVCPTESGDPPTSKVGTASGYQVLTATHSMGTTHMAGDTGQRLGGQRAFAMVIKIGQVAFVTGLPSGTSTFQRPLLSITAPSGEDCFSIALAMDMTMTTAYGLKFGDGVKKDQESGPIIHMPAAMTTDESSHLLIVLHEVVSKGTKEWVLKLRMYEQKDKYEFVNFGVSMSLASRDEPLLCPGKIHTTFSTATVSTDAGVVQAAAAIMQSKAGNVEEALGKVKSEDPKVYGDIFNTLLAVKDQSVADAFGRLEPRLVDSMQNGGSADPELQCAMRQFQALTDSSADISHLRCCNSDGYGPVEEGVTPETANSKCLPMGEECTSAFQCRDGYTCAYTDTICRKLAPFSRRKRGTCSWETNPTVETRSVPPQETIYGALKGGEDDSTCECDAERLEGRVILLRGNYVGSGGGGRAGDGDCQGTFVNDMEDDAWMPSARNQTSRWSRPASMGLQMAQYHDGKWRLSGCRRRGTGYATAMWLPDALNVQKTFEDDVWNPTRQKLKFLRKNNQPISPLAKSVGEKVLAKENSEFASADFPAANTVISRAVSSGTNFDDMEKAALRSCALPIPIPIPGGSPNLVKVGSKIFQVQEAGAIELPPNVKVKETGLAAFMYPNLYSDWLFARQPELKTKFPSIFDTQAYLSHRPAALGEDARTILDVDLLFGNAFVHFCCKESRDRRGSRNDVEDYSGRAETLMENTKSYVTGKFDTLRPTNGSDAQKHNYDPCYDLSDVHSSHASLEERLPLCCPYVSVVQKWLKHKRQRHSSNGYTVIRFGGFPEDKQITVSGFRESRFIAPNCATS